MGRKIFLETHHYGDAVISVGFHRPNYTLGDDGFGRPVIGYDYMSWVADCQKVSNELDSLRASLAAHQAAYSTLCEKVDAARAVFESLEEAADEAEWKQSDDAEDIREKCIEAEKAFRPIEAEQLSHVAKENEIEESIERAKTAFHALGAHFEDFWRNPKFS